MPCHALKMPPVIEQLIEDFIHYPEDNLIVDKFIQDIIKRDSILAGVDRRWKLTKKAVFGLDEQCGHEAYLTIPFTPENKKYARNLINAHGSGEPPFSIVSCMRIWKPKQIDQQELDVQHLRVIQIYESTSSGWRPYWCPKYYPTGYFTVRWFRAGKALEPKERKINNEGPASKKRKLDYSGICDF